MINYYIIAFFFLTTCLFPYNEVDIESIPIQESGRIKPLDTFARNNLLSFYGKRNLAHEDISAIEWLFTLFADPDSAFNKDVFNIDNPEIVYTLNLEWKNNYHKYSYREVLEGIKDQQEYFSSLALKPEEQLTRKEIDFIDWSNPN